MKIIITNMSKKNPQLQKKDLKTKTELLKMRNSTLEHVTITNTIIKPSAHEVNTS